MIPDSFPFCSSAASTLHCSLSRCRRPTVVQLFPKASHKTSVENVWPSVVVARRLPPIIVVVSSYRPSTARGSAIVDRFLVLENDVPVIAQYQLGHHHQRCSNIQFLFSNMIHRLFLILGAAIALAFSAEAFAPKPAFFKPAVASSTELMASRINAKKQKIKRNRENMRKFSSPGKKGTSRRKTLKKILSNKARQLENEFIAKCFITGPPPNESED